MPVPDLTTDALWELLANRGKGVLATIKRDGRPQLSNISYTWDAESRTLITQAADMSLSFGTIGLERTMNFFNK